MEAWIRGPTVREDPQGWRIATTASMTWPPLPPGSPWWSSCGSRDSLRPPATPGGRWCSCRRTAGRRLRPAVPDGVPVALGLLMLRLYGHNVDRPGLRGRAKRPEHTPTTIRHIGIPPAGEARGGAVHDWPRGRRVDCLALAAILSLLARRYALALAAISSLLAW